MGDSVVCDARNRVEFLPKEVLLKFLILGDFGVGKTSIVRRYTEGKFSPHYKITIGAEFALKRINWDENTKINLQLWDIAGHERFGYLTRVYYKYAVAAAIVFDVSRIETLHSVEKWLLDLRSKVTQPNGDPIPVILLANKGDVNMENLPFLEISKICKKFDIINWYLTSAKDNSNIDEALVCLIEKSLENKTCGVYNRNDNITLTDDKKKVIKKSACCG